MLNPGVNSATSEIGQMAVDDVDNEPSSPAHPSGNGVRSIFSAAAFLVLAAVVGVTSVLAWRAYVGELELRSSQGARIGELEAAIRQLRDSQEALAQRVNRVEAGQQQLALSRGADLLRLSEQVAALDREVEESRKSATKPPAQKRSSAVASATAKPNSDH
jgi:hypothetical protein